MKIFGIFGDPIEHSLSPAMQNAALRALGEEACYHSFRVKKVNLKDALLGAAAMGFSGLNLTIPLKEKARELDFLQPDPLAQAIGAVNTVSFSESRGIAGYNTDGWGALLALQDAGVKVRDKSVLIIGAGGAARAIAYTLEQEGAEISIANRSTKRAQDLAASVGAMGFCLCDLERLVPSVDIIINCTSVGMGEGDPRLLEGRLLQSRHAVFDIVYNRETELLQDARAAGAVALDGVMMLVYQGARALEIWTGKKAPVDVMEKAVREALLARQTERR
ncbi:MAG: shikimate dehydrogenase [Methanotrichaceae archaeon]|nr:shikimate dehydrogenase [Methanotrichaceae archaeon]